MNKPKWRQITNEMNDSIFTPIFYILYLKGMFTEDQVRKLIERPDEPKTIEAFMDELDELLR